MAIEVKCKDCGNDYRLSDDKAGTTVKCRECGSKINVPAGKSSTSSSTSNRRRNSNDDEDGELFDSGISNRSRSTSTVRRPSKKAGGGSSKAVMIGAGAVAAVVMFAVVTYLMSRGGGNQNVAQNNSAPPAMPNSNIPSPPAPNPSAQGSGLPSSPPPQVAQGTGLPNAGGNNPPGAGLPNSPPPNALPGGNNANPAANGFTPPPPTGPPGAGVPAALPGGKKFGGFAGGDAGAGNGAEGRMPSMWDVKLDPAPADTKLDAAKISNIRFPKGAGHTDIVYPASPSVFVAVGANNGFGPIREIWNLGANKKVGTVTTDFVKGRAISALSPDGEHLAIGHFFQPKNGVSVWVTKTGKALGALETTSEVSNVLFAGKTHLIGICKDKTAKVWKMPTGDLEHDLAIDDGTEPNNATVTPGGKYLAVVTSKSSLKMFDLDSGNVAGELPLPFDDVFFAGKPDGMTISADGKRLAIVMPTQVFEKDLVIYDMADGKLLKKFALNVKDLGHQPDALRSNRLEFFGDDSRLLWRGHYVLDDKIGGPIWRAPEENGSSDAPRKLVGKDKILVVVGGHQSPSLKLANVPLDEIEVSAKTVEAGGEASDAGMPTLITADVSGVTPIAAGGVASWSMKPDGTSPAAKPPKSSIALPRERPSIGGAFISNPSAGKAVVWYSDDFASVAFAKGLVIHQRKPPRTGPGTAMVDVVDLASGKSQTTLELPYNCTVLDVSPDGDAVAVKTRKPNEERMDVYDVNTGKPIAGWRPYQQKEDFHKGITIAKMIDRDHCLTQNFGNVTYLWKLPECKAVWRLTDASNFCLSPGGKYLGFLSHSRYMFMEARTGELVAEIPVTMPEIHCAFHFMGTHLAVLASDRVSRKITVIDVATGKSTADFYTPQGNDTVQWCGDTALLIDGTWLVDLQKQRNAWQYQLPFGTRAQTQPDGRHWFLVASNPLDQNVFLTGAQLPEKQVADKIAATELPDESLLKPGMQIALQVNLAANSTDHPNLVNDVTNNFRAGMEKNGFQVAQNAPLTFVISTSQANDGEPMKFRQFGRGGRAETSVPRIKITCEVALLQNGQAVWKHTNAISNGAFGIVRLRDGEDISTHLSKQMWDGVANHLGKFPVPAQAFGQTAGGGLGKSLLVAGGTQPSR